MSGLCYADPKLNKDHTDFYILKDVAALEVYYGCDGEMPEAIVFYFPTDKDFPKLTRDNLAKRLAWDESHLKNMLVHYDRMMVKAFPWEIDQKERAKLQQGEFSVNFNAKLEAWIESGKKLGYKYQHEEDSNTWHWYGPGGKRIRAIVNRKLDGTAVEFVWYHEGGSGELRRDTFYYSSSSGDLISHLCLSKSAGAVRYESTGIWCWYGKDSTAIRIEWDDNGDGIPDWYITNPDATIASEFDKNGLEMLKPLRIDDSWPDNIVNVSNNNALEKRKPLKLENSWAINPKLIPKESGIPDLPDLRLPIRRKVDAKPATK